MPLRVPAGRDTRHIRTEVLPTIKGGLRALYRTLDRLESKGYVNSWFSDPTPERGGRSKRYFSVRPLGLRTLRASRDALAAMWEGLEPQVSRGS